VKLVDGVEYLPITCAVCENLSNALILGADVVAKIHEKLLNERYMPNVNCGEGDVDKTRGGGRVQKLVVPIPLPSTPPSPPLPLPYP